MTPAEIRAGVDKHKLRIAELRAQLEGEIGIERAHIRKFQGFCSHPRRFETSCMGDSGWHCPDCDDGG